MTKVVVGFWFGIRRSKIDRVSVRVQPATQLPNIQTCRIQLYQAERKKAGVWGSRLSIPVQRV